MSDPHAVVLLSGGLDSAVCLAIARARGLVAHTLSIDYGQRHRHELVAADRLALALGAADHRTIALDLRAVGGSALTDQIDVPKAAPSAPALTAAAPAIPVTYVPARNMTFLAIAAGLAEVVGACSIFIGVNAVDYSGYPDCRPGFIDAFQRCLAVGTRAGAEGRPIRVETPLLHLSKAEIIREGARLGVDFALTRSCYDPDDLGRACGQCDSCRLRRAGFAAAGVPDPTSYHPRAHAAPVTSVSRAVRP